MNPENNCCDKPTKPEDLNDLSSILYASQEKRKPPDNDLMRKLGLTYDDLADVLPKQEFKPRQAVASEPEVPPQAPVERIPIISFSTDNSKDIIFDFNRENQFYQRSVGGPSQIDSSSGPCPQCFQYLLDHEDYPLDDYEQITVSMRSPSSNTEKRKREFKELQEDLKRYQESIPADAGLPLTTPKRSPYPRRPMSFSIEREMDPGYSQSPRFQPKKTSTPKGHCCHSNKGNSYYYVSTPQASLPFHVNKSKEPKSTLADIKDSDTSKFKKKPSRRYPLTDLRKTYDKKTVLPNKKQAKKPQKKLGNSTLTKKPSPLLTTILPTRPMHRVVSEVFDKKSSEVGCCFFVSTPQNVFNSGENDSPQAKHILPFALTHPMCMIKQTSEMYAGKNKRFILNPSHLSLSNHPASINDWLPYDQPHEEKLNQFNFNERMVKSDHLLQEGKIILIEYESNHNCTPHPTLIEYESKEALKSVDKIPSPPRTPNKHKSKLDKENVQTLQLRELKSNHTQKKKTENQKTSGSKEYTQQLTCKKLSDSYATTNKRGATEKEKNIHSDSNETTDNYHTPKSSITNESKSKNIGKSSQRKIVPQNKLRASSCPSAAFPFISKLTPEHFHNKKSKQKSALPKCRKHHKFRSSSRPLLHVDSITDVSSTNIVGVNNYKKNLATITYSSKSKQLVQPVILKSHRYSLSKNSFLKSLDKQKKPGFSSFKKNDFNNAASSSKHTPPSNKEPRRTIRKNSKPRRLSRSPAKSPIIQLDVSEYPTTSNRLFSQEKLMTNCWHVNQLYSRKFNPEKMNHVLEKSKGRSFLQSKKSKATKRDDTAILRKSEITNRKQKYREGVHFK